MLMIDPKEIKYAFVNVAQSQTDSSLVAAVTAKKVKVLGVMVLSSAATAVTFNTKGSGSGTAISPPWACGANGGFVLPLSDNFWFETSMSQALTVTTGAGGTTGIQVVYIQD